MERYTNPVKRNKGNRKYGNPVMLPNQYNDEISHEERLTSHEERLTKLKGSVEELIKNTQAVKVKDAIANNTNLYRIGDLRILQFVDFEVTATLIGTLDSTDKPATIFTNVVSAYDETDAEDVYCNVKVEGDGEVYIVKDGLAITSGTVNGAVVWTV